MGVFALYPRNQVVRILVGALYIIDSIAIGVGTVGLPKLGYDGHCTMAQVSKVALMGT